MLKSLLLVLFVLHFALPQTFALGANAASGASKVEQLLKNARQKFYNAQYDIALKMLENYLEHGKMGKTKPILHFYVITSIGHIYLRVKQDPDGAIKFFSKVENDPRLKKSEQDIVSGWIDGAKEWKKLGKLPKDVSSADELFELGQKYYVRGVQKMKHPMDPAGNAEFSIAAAYLVPFTVRYDKDQRDGEALYMLGDIRRRTWSDNQYWSENFYLTEVIRRYPGTPLAMKAYQALDEDVHFGYSGSSGDETPSSWVDLLKDLKTLAEGKNPTPKKSNGEPSKSNLN